MKTENVVSRIKLERDFREIKKRRGYWPDDSFDPEHVVQSPFPNTVVSPLRNLRELTDEILEEIRDIDITEPIGLSEPDATGFRERGDEWIARYAPFHFYRSNWGIFFHLDRFQRYIVNNCLKYQEPVGGFGEELVRKTLHHENLHFLVEYFGAIASQLKYGGGVGSIENSVYESHNATKRGNSWRAEEALANAYALTRGDYKTKNLRGGHNLTRYLREICDSCGPGYSDYAEICIGGPVPIINGVPMSTHKFGLKPEEVRRALIGFSDLLFREEEIKLPIVPSDESWSLLDNKTNIPKNMLKGVPLYLVEEKAGQQSPYLEYRIQPQTMRLKEFYKLLDKNFGLKYEEGGKHGKLNTIEGKSINAWKRRGKKSEVVKRYQIDQVAVFLDRSSESLWRQLQK